MVTLADRENELRPIRANIRAVTPGGFQLETRLALVRATHLNTYISVLRDMGAPIDRELAQSRLPKYIEETPDLYVSLPIAMEWVARTGRDLPAMELGLIGAQAASLSSLPPTQQAAIMTAQTGLKRLEALSALSRYEDSALEMSIRQEADEVRVTCNMRGMERHPHVCFAEWLNLQAIISVMRSVVGPTWYPSELCFTSTNRLPDAVHVAFPDTRILVGQAFASIVVERACLALSTSVLATNAQATHRPAPQTPGPVPLDSDQIGQSEDWEFVTLLRKMVQPYLADRSTNVAFIAEMAGISKRTLQRRLKLCGSSYSGLLQEARFELARQNLENPTLKVIDVAMMAGYESPQHFTRAFRRFTGITPTDYRNQNFVMGSAAI
ncbi:AraC family transcriptional regulator [Stappia sp. BW2]|uniref:helix-turn-helix domain-containing protein n=1 Tax=Stappia sp. BW2 TaxID=2592622 RepID=UPI0011DEAF30|nr:AraC family transcriptional regulator [Stappia sp. BW2]TYC78563.1 AraC family transcriptional regulator [Stappia sp. BW2]